MFESRDDNDWVDISLELRKGLGQDFTAYDRVNKRSNYSWNVSAPPSYIPSIMTVVVPSPTSSSCVLLSSIILLAAGWETSISRRMA